VRKAAHEPPVHPLRCVPPRSHPQSPLSPLPSLALARARGPSGATCSVARSDVLAAGGSAASCAFLATRHCQVDQHDAETDGVVGRQLHNLPQCPHVTPRPADVVRCSFW
jgi:hypothetical protein